MEAEARLCSRFISSALALRSPQAMVAVNDEGLVVGTCLAGVAGRTNEAWRPDYERLLAEATERAKTADEDLEGSLFGDIRELATADAFIASGNAYGASQVNLIMLYPGWQGRGLGRLLMDEGRRALAQAGAERFFLITDNRSDWQFYEHIGMERVLESHDQDTGDGFITYVYGGRTLARARVTTGYSAVGGINPNVSHPSPCGASHWYSQVKQSLST